MVYITGENDTLATLQQIDEFNGTSEEYGRRLCQVNRHLNGSRLAPYTPVLLLCDEAESSQELCAFMRELAAAPKEERAALRQLQENKIDLPTVMAMQDIMDDFRTYSKGFVDFYNDPLIKQPWLDSSQILTNGSIFDMLPGMAGIAAGSIGRMRRVAPTEQLLEAMARRDAFNTRAARLMAEGRGKHFLEIRNLEAAAKKETAKIKQLLPKKVDDKLVKYLSKRGVDVYKARNNSYSLKMAKKGRLSTLSLDLLNRSGLERSRAVIRGLIRIGSAADKIAFWAGPAITLYNTNEAYKAKQDYGKVFVSGMAGVGAGYAMTTASTFTAWGACAIGTLAGDAALGSLLLASSPVWGTGLAILVGVAVVGFVAYEASNLVEYAWDSDLGKQAREKVYSAYQWMEHKFAEGWTKSEEWFHSFFTPEAAN